MKSIFVYVNVSMRWYDVDVRKLVSSGENEGHFINEILWNLTFEQYESNFVKSICICE